MVSLQLLAVDKATARATAAAADAAVGRRFVKVIKAKGIFEETTLCLESGDSIFGVFKQQFNVLAPYEKRL